MSEEKFEDAMKRLEDLVRHLEEGELPLEDALAAFEEGMTLLKFCSRKLEEAEKKVSLLVQENGGKYTPVPFDMEPEDGKES